MTGNPRGSRFCSECGRRLASGTPSTLAQSLAQHSGAFLFVAQSGALRPGSLDLDALMESLAEVSDAHGGEWQGELGSYRVWFPAAPTKLPSGVGKAIRCGLALRGRLGPAGAGVRLGVHAGSQLAVGHAGHWQVVVEAHEVVAGLLAAAVSEGVVVSDAVLDLAASHLTSTPLEAGAGRSMFQVRAWRDPQPIRPSWAVEGLPLACDEDLQHLHMRWSEVAQNKGARSLTLLGPDGSGKRRLIEEFQAQLPEGRVVRYAEGYCSDSARLVPMAPITELVLKLLDVEEGAPEPEGQLRLRHGARRACVALGSTEPDREAAEMAAVLGILLGLEVPSYNLALGSMEPEVFRLHAFFLLVRLIQGLSTTSPCLLVLHHLHYADATTLDFLQFLGVNAHGEGRYLLLMTGQPELLELRTSWGRGWWRHEQVELMHLEQEELVELGRGVASRRGAIPDSFLSEIARRAGGDPYYMEQASFLLAGKHKPREEEERMDFDDDEDVVFDEDLPEDPARIDLPSSMEGLCERRLQALDDASRRLLQLAATVGLDFSSSIIQGLWEGELDSAEEAASELLARLEAAGFIRHHVDEDAWRFRGEAMWRVALAGIGEDDVRAWNRRLARLLEVERGGTRCRARYAQIATYYDRGGSHPTALRLFILGVRRARRIGSVAEVKLCFDRAAAQVRPSEGGRGDGRAALTLHLTRGQLALSVGQLESAVSDLQLAVDFARVLGDTRRECEALLLLSEALDRSGSLERARLSAGEAEVLASGLVDPRLRVLSLRRQGWLGMRSGDVEGARRFLEDAVRMARGEGLEPVDVAQAIDELAAFEWLRGDERRAAVGLDELIGQLRRGQPVSIPRVVS